MEVITGGITGEYTVSLTNVAGEAGFTNGMDLAARMRVLEPLRSWLEIHGALTPGSGVLVRTLPEHMRPQDRAEELAMPGTVMDRRELHTTLHTPTGM